jgi:hypothetical protein
MFADRGDSASIVVEVDVNIEDESEGGILCGRCRYGCKKALSTVRTELLV